MKKLTEDRICSLCGNYIYKGDIATEHNFTMDYAGHDTVQHYSCANDYIEKEREQEENPPKGKTLQCILPWFLIAALFTPTFPEYEGEDFTDTGVGCTDDCLEPAVEEEI
jgi:hypothetical protein